MVRLPRHGASCPVAIAVSCSADRQALGKITPEGVFLEQLETDPAHYMPDAGTAEDISGGEVVQIDLTRPMDEILAELSKHPVKTRLSLTGPLVVARDIAHAKIKERLDAGEEMPSYLRDHPVYYAGPAKTPAGHGVRLVRADDGRPDGLLRRAVPGRRRLEGDARQGQPLQGRDARRATRTAASTSARSAARRPGSPRTASRRSTVLEYEELGMEAVWKIEVEDFPAFIVVDDKGNDFFTDPSGAVTCRSPASGSARRSSRGTSRRRRRPRAVRTATFGTVERGQVTDRRLDASL